MWSIINNKVVDVSEISISGIQKLSRGSIISGIHEKRYNEDLLKTILDNSEIYKIIDFVKNKVPVRENEYGYCFEVSIKYNVEFISKIYPSKDIAEKHLIKFIKQLNKGTVKISI